MKNDRKCSNIRKPNFQLSMEVRDGANGIIVIKAEDSHTAPVHCHVDLKEFPEVEV